MNLSHHWVALRLAIGPNTRVLDVGGSAAGFALGDVTGVDLLPRDDGRKSVRVDICREPLPFDDDEFDVCICGHTLEDLYNPFLAIDEMRRVAKRGYFETPHRGLEICYGVSPEQGTYPGWGHHHWIFETTSPTSFRVLPKSWHLLRHDAAKVAQWAGPSSFEFFWFGGFDYSVLQCLDEDGDHWDELVSDHNAFVAANRHLLHTVEELEDPRILTPRTNSALLANPMFLATAQPQLLAQTQAQPSP